MSMTTHSKERQIMSNIISSIWSFNYDENCPIRIPYAVGYYFCSVTDNTRKCIIGHFNFNKNKTLKFLEISHLLRNC